MANPRLNTIAELLRRCQPTQPGEDNRPPPKWIFNPDLLPVGETWRLHQRRVDLAAAWLEEDDFVSVASRIRTREAVVRQDIRAMRAALRNRGHTITRAMTPKALCSLFLKEFATLAEEKPKTRKRKFVFKEDHIPGKFARPEVYQRLADAAAEWRETDNWTSYLARHGGLLAGDQLRGDLMRIRSMVRAWGFGPIGRDPGHNFEFCQLFLALFCERVEGAPDEVADRPSLRSPPSSPRGQDGVPSRPPPELKLQPPAPAPPAIKRVFSGPVIYSLIRSIDRRRRAGTPTQPSAEMFAALLMF